MLREAGWSVAPQPDLMFISQYFSTPLPTMCIAGDQIASLLFLAQAMHGYVRNTYNGHIARISSSLVEPLASCPSPHILAPRCLVCALWTATYCIQSANVMCVSLHCIRLLHLSFSSLAACHNLLPTKERIRETIRAIATPLPVPEDTTLLYGARTYSIFSFPGPPLLHRLLSSTLFFRFHSNPTGHTERIFYRSISSRPFSSFSASSSMSRALSRRYARRGYPRSQRVARSRGDEAQPA